MTLGRLSPSLLPFDFYSLLPHKMDGPSTCSISTAPFLMVNLTLMKRSLWNSHQATKNLTRKSTSANYSNHSTDSNKQAENGTMSSAGHLLILNSNEPKQTRLCSTFTKARILSFLLAMSMTVRSPAV